MKRVWFLLIPALLLGSSCRKSNEERCAESCLGSYTYEHADGCNHVSRCTCLGAVAAPRSTSTRTASADGGAK